MNKATWPAFPPVQPERVKFPNRRQRENPLQIPVVSGTKPIGRFPKNCISYEANAKL